MAVSVFNAGTLVTVTATFESTAGVPTDPTTISMRYALQGQPTIVWTYGGAGSISRTGTGVYVAELDTTNLFGTWFGAWIGTGACQVTQPFTFQVGQLGV